MLRERLYIEGHVARNCGRHLGADNSLQLRGTLVVNLEDHLGQSLKECGSRLFPGQASDENAALANI